MTVRERSSSYFAEIGDLPRRAGERENMHARIRAIDGIDVPAVVHLHVVGLNRDLASLFSALADAAFVGLISGGGNIKANFLGMKRITNVNRSHPRVEMRQK